MYIPNAINTPFSRKIFGRLFEAVCHSDAHSFCRNLERREQELWQSSSAERCLEKQCEFRLPVPLEGDVQDFMCCEYWQRRLSNKIMSKNFAKNAGVLVATLLWYGKNPDDIPFGSLGGNFVVKCSQGWASQQVLVVRDYVDLLSKAEVNERYCRNWARKVLANDGFGESYILIEELLSSSDGIFEVQKDYKFFCFDGDAKFVQCIDRSLGVASWYYPDWRRIPDQMHLLWKRGQSLAKPLRLENMLATAAHLSRLYGYPFVRVDLYDTSRGVVFGEFTHTPNSGRSKKLFTPYARREMGRLWDRALERGSAQYSL